MVIWDNVMEVHIESIDVQHRTLVALINELQNVIDNGGPQVMVGSVLSKVIDYTNFHFEHEENCLIVGCYTRFKEHQCIHNEISQKLKQLEREYLNGIPGVAPRVLELLQRWAMEHIMKTDQLYSKQLVNAGLQ